MHRFTVKQARLLAGITQAEAAQALNICEQTYRKIERNPEATTVAQALEISRLFGKSCDEIFFDENSSFIGGSASG